MKVLVAGAGGMVGRAVVEWCASQGDQVAAHTHQSLDITDEKAVRALFETTRPDTVINCAAWTDVDGCELDQKRAYAVNAQAVETLAANGRRVGASLVTISTDYVFDGAKQGFYTQRDDPNPTSIYGAAKLEGERRAAAALARTMVVRTGWIFGIGGRNFLSLIIQRVERGERLRAISDSWGTPTYACDLAKRLRELAERDLPGIYHVINSGMGTSYEEFARAALTARGTDGCQAAQIESVSMHSLRRPAPRPQNSQLRCLVSEAVGLPPLPDWRSALKEFAVQTRQ